MDKTTKNIIEAGITPAEFDDLFGDTSKNLCEKNSMNG